MLSLKGLELKDKIPLLIILASSCIDFGIGLALVWAKAYINASLVFIISILAFIVYLDMLGWKRALIGWHETIEMWKKEEETKAKLVRLV